MTKGLLDFQVASFIDHYLHQCTNYSHDREIEEGLDFFFQTFSFYLRHSYITQVMHLELIKRYCSTNGALYAAISSLLNIPYSGAYNLPNSIDSYYKIGLAMPSLIVDLNDLYLRGYTNTSKLYSEDVCKTIFDFIPELSGSMLLSNGRYVSLPRIELPHIPEDVVLINIPLRELLRREYFVDLLIVKNSARNLLEYFSRYEMMLVSGRLCLSFAHVHSLQSEAAQAWHFDLDGIGFVKQFIYLNDVDENNGAHMYIPHSHKPGGKNQLLLNRGYSRIADSDMNCMQNGTPITICGEAGSTFFGSTLCWHKGGAIQSGMRAMIILEYSVSKFQIKVS